MMPRVRYSQIAVLPGEMEGANEPCLYQPPTPSPALRRVCRADPAFLRRVLLAYSRTSLSQGVLSALNECRTAVVIGQTCGQQTYGIAADAWQKNELRRGRSSGEQALPS